MNGSQDLSGIIGRLTENPEMMKSLMGIAGKLMNGDNGGEDSKSHHIDREETPYRNPGVKRDSCQPQDCEKGYNDNTAGSHHPEKDCDDCPHKGGRSSDAENLIRLLIALKPYVGKERCEKIDGIVKILKLVQLSEKTGLLKSLL